jgi:cytochrome c oxidase cbb3-type subunit 4
MDINSLRALSTVLVFFAFIAVCWWAYAPKRRKRFAEAALLPFAEDARIAAAHQSPNRVPPIDSSDQDNKQGEV